MLTALFMMTFDSCFIPSSPYALLYLLVWVTFPREHKMTAEYCGGVWGTLSDRENHPLID